MVSDGVRIESVTHKMHDKEVTGYPAFLPQIAYLFKQIIKCATE